MLVPTLLVLLLVIAIGGLMMVPRLPAYRDWQRRRRRRAHGPREVIDLSGPKGK